MFNRNVIAGICLVASFVVGGCSHKTEVSYTPVNHSDQNWVNGIATSWATAFFVKNSVQAQQDFVVGNKVKFSDGTVRTIVRLKENEGSLIVFLDGPPLDGAAVGYPKTLTVLVDRK